MTALPFTPAFELGLDSPQVREVLARLVESHELVAVFDEDERAVWATEPFAELLGGPSGILGVSLEDLLESGPGFDGIRAGLTATGAGAGRLRLAASGSPLVDASVFNHALSALFVLVARPVERDLGVAPTTDFLTSILDNAPDAVIAIELGGFVTYANSAAAALLGRTRGEIVGRPVAILFDRASGIDSIITEMNHGMPQSQDVELKRPDGSTRWLCASGSRLRHGDGRPIGGVVFLHDITDRKRIEADLERKNDELESYVLNVSHDLRSPLVSVRGFARLLREDYQSLLDEQGLHFVRRIEQAGLAMDTLIEELLELSRIGRTDEPLALIDPRAVLRQVDSDLKAELDEKDIALVVPPEPPMLRCNRTRLYQLLSNLVSNAAVHMRAAGAAEAVEPGRIEVEIEARPQYWEIIVRDNGVGIAADHHERIFEIFTTLGPRADGKKSTGIGLATVRKIASMHGGRAWVESAPGEGAAFHATLLRR